MLDLELPFHPQTLDYRPLAGSNYAVWRQGHGEVTPFLPRDAVLYSAVCAMEYALCPSVQHIPEFYRNIQEWINVVFDRKATVSSH